MTKVFGYIRVSTAKQGMGVSLIAQKEAIERYAVQHNLEIIQWFEEKETAAKEGRPLFGRIMKLLKAQKAQGIITHKIDRSARNYRDWVDITDLLDRGYEVHFAHESLDLKTRGGRLAADLQVAVAVDYIRNLREEAIKGLYGRLKQGIWPFNAPIGYLNKGRGNYKVICPEQGPLARKAFELYATGKYSLKTLVKAVRELGLKGMNKQPITIQSLSQLLNNPFYIGILKVKNSRFNGGHEPLVSPALFQTVQSILKGKFGPRINKHEVTYRKLIKCFHCATVLIPELQKGHIYYRCHRKGCPTKSVRASRLEQGILRAFAKVQLLPTESINLEEILQENEAELHTVQQQLVGSLQLQKANLEAKLERLTDCYIEQALDKELFEKRKGGLLLELKTKEDRLNQISNDTGYIVSKVKKYLELSKSLINSFQMQNDDGKREILKVVTSNLQVAGKKLIVSMHSPFLELSERHFILDGELNRDTTRNRQQEIDVSANAVVDFTLNPPLNRENLKALINCIIEIMRTESS